MTTTTESSPAQRRALWQAQAAIPTAIEAAQLAVNAVERAPLVFELGALLKARRQLHEALASLQEIQAAVNVTAREQFEEAER